MWSEWTSEVEVLKQMLVDRRYTSIRSIGRGGDPLLVCSCVNTEGELCLVFFGDEPKVGVKTLRQTKAEAEGSGAKHIIFVTRAGLTHFAQRELQAGEGARMEIFCKAELSFNVTHHSLVPPHRLVRGDERRAVLEMLDCKPAQLPKIRESDPVVRYFGWSPGSVVRVDRCIGSLESEVMYRVVA
jgi:DNA-directed RNA polymerase I, II, and III subunit RPABC1